MARNDVVLLDSLLAKANAGAGRTYSETFEIFCFDQLLKNYDLAIDDLEEGWVDSGDDGGIDGFFVFLNDRLLNSDPDEDYRPRAPTFEIWIITAKRGETFRQTPINSLLASLPELFDLRTSEDNITYPFEQTILDIRETFRRSYVDLAGSRPSLRLNVVYASRGDTASVAPNVSVRADQLRNTLSGLFGSSIVSVRFAGASELLELSRRRKTYSLGLKFIENTISREQSNYVVLARLRDYLDFIRDEDGGLRRYLFDSNVRDWLGEAPVNRDIDDTLANDPTDSVDFWWLNNGITILASYATIAGKEINLENVQIVNGLQTTEAIYNHFTRRGVGNDERAVLVKIVVTENEEVRDRIIKATNYQNPVELASLRATDRIQRDIEHFLYDHGWYYDRRKNFYRNQGVPTERIVSMPYLGSCVRALVLRDPVMARRQRARFMRKDDEYRKVFDGEWPLNVFLASLEIVRAVEKGIRERGASLQSRLSSRKERDARFVIAYAILCGRLRGRLYNPAAVAEIGSELPSGDEVEQVIDAVLQVAERFSAERGRSSKLTRLLRSSEFMDYLSTSPEIVG